MAYLRLASESLSSASYPGGGEESVFLVSGTGPAKRQTSARTCTGYIDWYRSC